MVLQCANCCRTDEECGTALRRCGACQRAFYCSKECQVSDRPRHKDECKRHSAAPSTTSTEVQDGVRLHEFFKIHQQKINECAIHALCAHSDVRLRERCFLRLALHSVPDAATPASFFTLMDASIVHFAAYWRNKDDNHDPSTKKTRLAPSKDLLVVVLEVNGNHTCDLVTKLAVPKLFGNLWGDPFLWKRELHLAMTCRCLQERVPAGNDDLANDLTGRIDLSGLSFLRPHFAEQVLLPLACVKCAKLPGPSSTATWPRCPRCKHATYCSPSCLAAATSMPSHTKNCKKRAELPMSEVVSAANVAEFVTSNANLEVFRVAALVALDAAHHPARLIDRPLVIQLRRRKGASPCHPDHQYSVHRAQTLASSLIPYGEHLMRMYEYHYEASLEQISGPNDFGACPVLYVDLEEKAYFMDTVLFRRETARMSILPRDWRAWLNVKINGASR
ncbi:hypothetical protein EXIGLDRAFT_830784 [Exidia glandulosa HHB12029]|uniref:MYND-type domain-containing protein n=1 Tax=Exidia glandulosa HHB12029 TaxID=1314781 RepID=A0A165N8L8_EXIGL|nr:hypothetical protein EXIGLDRAFT_830784 [Exidia glandulosa HHB12029]